MSQSEVFRPNNGDLFVRDPVASGPPISADVFRRRPQSHSGYRFGQMSHNSFFTRHNPHPNRVRHFKGLLDVPICSVNDDGYFASPRYSLQFPPNNFNQTKLANYGRIPVNALNVNSQLHPINTITGLQYFTGLNSYPFREKAIPKVGMVPVTEAWRDELKAFTDQLNLAQDKPREVEKPLDERPRTTQYSAETGRLIPPPSRAMSRGASRRGRQPMPNMQHISAEPDMENMVMSMLCQILQTEDVNAVQSWLVSAGDREKTMVMDMLRGAIAGREEYSRQYPVEFVPERKTVLPPINDKQIIGDGNDDMIDRLTLHEEPVIPKQAPAWVRAVNAVEPVEPMPGIPAVTPPETNPAVPVPPPTQPQLPMKPSSPKPIIEDDGIPIKPPTNEVFKPMSSRPPTQGGRASMVNGLDTKPPGTADARLKYTKSPLVNGTMPDPMWNQNQSISNNTF